MTVTDTLETVLTLVGAQSLIGGLAAAEKSLLALAGADEAATAAQKELRAASAALLLPVSQMLTGFRTAAADVLSSVLTFQALAEAEGVAAAATGVLDAALALLTAPLTLIAGLLAALAAGAIAAGKAVSAFSQSEASTARLALQMKNLGNVFPTPQLVAFANHLQDVTGISHTVIQNLGAMAAQFGLNQQQIKAAVPAVLDISQAKGLDPEQVLQRILQASAGRTRGLIALGIDPRKITGDLHDVNNLISQIGKGFSGVAAGFRDTLPGTVSALGASTQRLWEALGRFVSPVVVPILNSLIFVIDKLTALLTFVANKLPGLFPTSANLGGGAASDLALKGDPEQTALLGKIATNTSKQADAFVQAVLGGPGVVARAAFTARDARIAFGI